MELSTLDFAYAHAAADKCLRKCFCERLIAALSYSGFVKLVNHGISVSLIEEAFKWNQRFFALPEDVKVKATGAESSRYRGFIRRGAENASKVHDYVNGERKGKDVTPDIKESYDIGSDTDTFLPNSWLSEDELPGFHTFMNTFYETSRALRGEVLTVLEHALDLPSGRLTSLTDGNASCLRLNYYPACEVRDLQTGTKRISEHQDAGDITLLFQDKIGGLEIEDRQNQGKYLAVPNVQGPEIILNIGDTLQRWTNDRLRSTSHRVVLPQELLAASMGQVEARHSIAFFGKANRDATVGSLPDFVPPEQEPKYENITAWQYQKRRTDVLYG